MKFGICRGAQDAQACKDMGFDYIEGNLREIAEMSESQISESKKMLADAGITMEAANCFFPGDIALSGPGFKQDEVFEYSHRCLQRAAELGIKIAVLGSGGARKIPENMDKNDAYSHYSSLFYKIGDIAKENGVTIAVEPLNKRECNIFNTVGEVLNFTNALAHPYVKTLADIYHMEEEKEDYSILADCKEELVHVHFACPTNREYPRSVNEYDYSDFVKYLNAAGYNARLSIEARTEDFIADGTVALGVMKELFSMNN